jgi:DNA-binding MarR family transcriptional regulator
MEPEEELRYLVLAGQREGSRLLAGRLSQFGLTSAQAEAVRVLEDHGSMSLAALGARLVCETGSPSRLVSGLVGSGHVARTRSRSDRREVRLELTPRGRAAAAGVRSVEAEIHGAIRQALDPAEVAALVQALRRLVAGRPAGEALALRATPP